MITHMNEDDRTEIEKQKTMEALKIKIEDIKWKEENLESQGHVGSSEDSGKLTVLEHESLGQNDGIQKESDETSTGEEMQRQIYLGKQETSREQNFKWEAERALKVSYLLLSDLLSAAHIFSP